MPNLTSMVSCVYTPVMSDIEVRGTTPEEVIRDIENKSRISRENKYAFQVGLKDLDFDIDEDRIKIIGLNLPFRSIDQAEQALRQKAITPTKFIEHDDTEHQVLIFDHRPVGYSGFMDCVTHSLAMTNHGLFEAGRYPAINLNAANHYWQWFLHRRLTTPEEISDTLESQVCTIDQYMENGYQTIVNK
jgi:hypothetical protein